MTGPESRENAPVWETLALLGTVVGSSMLIFVWPLAGITCGWLFSLMEIGFGSTVLRPLWFISSLMAMVALLIYVVAS